MFPLNSTGGVLDGWRERGGSGAGKECDGQLVLPLVSLIPCHSQFQSDLLELLPRWKASLWGSGWMEDWTDSGDKAEERNEVEEMELT